MNNNNIINNETKDKINEYLEEIKYSSRNYFNANEPNFIANDGLYWFIIEYLSNNEINAVEEYINKAHDYIYVDIFTSDDSGNRNATFLSLALNDIELLKLLHKKLNIDLNLKRENYLDDATDMCNIYADITKDFINTEFYKNLQKIDESLCLKFSILHEAVLSGAGLEILEYLLKNNAKDVCVLDEDDNEIKNTTALDLAKELNIKATIELLEKYNKK